MATVICSSPKTKVYNPKTFFPHAALLHQSFLHCAISPTAASRRSLGRVSVPMWPINLSVRLPIVDLVGRYPTNYLIGRESIIQRIAPLVYRRCLLYTLCGISSRFQLLSPSERQVTHALLTRPPLSCHGLWPKSPSKTAPFDLHVLGTPPAFVLSQDQTLWKFVSQVFRLKIFSKLNRFSVTTLLRVVPLYFRVSNSQKFSGSLYSYRCLIFKVRCAYLSELPSPAALIRRSIILPHRSPLVNTFFSFFWIFFCKSIILLIFYTFSYIIYISEIKQLKTWHLRGTIMYIFPERSL